MKKAIILLSLSILFLGGNARADQIFYEVDFLGGNTWQFNYTVDNSAGLFAIEEFSIYFDLALFSNLSATATPAGWDPLVIQPDAGLPDDGFVDYLALGTAVDIGEILSGFSVAFDYLGTGTPGSQFFDFFDPLTFDLLASGETILAAGKPPTSVPEPSTFALLALGLFALAVSRRQRRVGKAAIH